jgi:hypothetical protein
MKEREGFYLRARIACWIFPPISLTLADPIAFSSSQLKRLGKILNPTPTG